MLQNLPRNIATREKIIKPGPVKFQFKSNPTNPTPINMNTEFSKLYASE
jgi:hypothetical protein